MAKNRASRADRPGRSFVPAWLRAAFGLVGGVLVVVGSWLLVGDVTRDSIKRVMRLPAVADAGEFRKLTPGTTVLLEGRLAARANPAPEGFLAYHHETFLGEEADGSNKGRQRWQLVETVTPELSVTAGAGNVTVAGGTYRLDTPPHGWKSDAVPRYVSLVQATQRYRGFRAGDVVTLDGTVLPGGALQATVLFGGDAAAYRRSVEAGATTVKIVGGIFSGFGVLLLSLVVWLGRIKPSAPPA